MSALRRAWTCLAAVLSDSDMIMVFGKASASERRKAIGVTRISRNGIKSSSRQRFSLYGLLR
eukprot:2488650-Prymnesium_polylepis.1